MASQLSQDSLSDMQPPPEASAPSTPQPSHATIPDSTIASISSLQANRLENASRNMTPPPSTQVPSSQRGKDRTPTPTASHISTPPPTIETINQSQHSKSARVFVGDLRAEDIASRSTEEIKTAVTELQAALQEAKMSAAHHKLQYQMLSQESSAAIERMAVEARMAQYENEVIHSAEQARAAATPVQSSPLQEGMIPVQKELYQRMCRDLQNLADDRNHLVSEFSQREKLMEEQEFQIERLNDKILLLREVVRESREQLNLYRRATNNVESTPRSAYTNTPLRHGVSRHEQPQPFAALLQASEMASQEARRPSHPSSSNNKRSQHSRNAHSISSLPTTPHHRGNNNSQASRQQQQQTPQNRHAPLKIPATAPVARTTNALLRTPDVYSHARLPVSPSPHKNRSSTIPAAPRSEGTVSASDDEENDSEAETDILDPDTDRIVITEDSVPATASSSQTSRVASQMLRVSGREEQAAAQRRSFGGRGMLEGVGSGTTDDAKNGGNERYRQTTLQGNVRKANVVRVREEDEEGGAPAAKRPRVELGGGAQGSPTQRQQQQQSPREVVGLGIAGFRH